MHGTLTLRRVRTSIVLGGVLSWNHGYHGSHLAGRLHRLQGHQGPIGVRGIRPRGRRANAKRSVHTGKSGRINHLIFYDAYFYNGLLISVSSVCKSTSNYFYRDCIQFCNRLLYLKYTHPNCFMSNRKSFAKTIAEGHP